MGLDLLISAYVIVSGGSLLAANMCSGIIAVKIFTDVLGMMMTPNGSVLLSITTDMIGEVLARAVIPEHVVPLMTAISGGDAYLLDDHLVLVGSDWATLIGYPLEGAFTTERLIKAIEALRVTLSVSILNLIAPEIPEGLLQGSQYRETDEYLVLDLHAWRTNTRLQRQVRKAEERLEVVTTKRFDRDHQTLSEEQIAQTKMQPMVEALYRALPRYLNGEGSRWILEARDRNGRLAAFFVVEGAAPGFDIYLLGASDRRHDVPHASDLLFKVMIEQAQQRGKPEIQLGLGVNPGIRRFKEKWGGKATLPYSACRVDLNPPSPISFLDQLLEDLT